MLLGYTENEEELFRTIVDKEFSRKKTEELLTYPNFAIKEELFGSNLYFIDSAHFFEFIYTTLAEMMRERTLIFRGVPEASYRMFNKAQRNFIKHDKTDPKSSQEFHSLITEMITNAKNLQQGILVKYFQAFGCKENDVAILSFLQHYGAPTPFLDWTYDFSVALFFGIRDIKSEEYKNVSKDNKDVSDFFSIYFMREDMPKYMVSQYKSLSAYSKKTTSYSVLKKRDVAFINEIYKSGNPRFYLSNNFNIINQKGIFIYNNSSNLPLEESFFKRSLMYYMLSAPKDDSTFRTPLICLNIHKRIVPAIKQYLIKEGYTNRVMFPNAKSLAQQSIPKDLK